ncbi:MAG: bifunctional hydroxymethylpyrimidine kinase/phosphomethylpyrimidine kinase [Bacteroidota bacterium]
MIIILSPPTLLPNEQQIVIQLFEVGLERFHLRKPDFSDIDIATYLSQIPMEYWNRIVLHSHHELTVQLGLGGVHWTERDRKEKSREELQALAADYRAEGLQISAAVHNLNDLNVLGDICDYVLISPVFDSISKTNYAANDQLSLEKWQGKVDAKLIALGGISNQTFPQAITKGFDGVAALGFIWQTPNQAIERFQQLQSAFQNPSKNSISSARPYVLTIAGHDPSGGAGLTADVKTFEQFQAYGLSVCTALTVQTDERFEQVEWVASDLIIRQSQILLSRFPIEVVKIGLVESWGTLEQILEMLKDQKIILDPILSTSTGFDFHSESSQITFQRILPQLTLLTPNREEILQLAPTISTPEEAAQQLSQHCLILLKGGHNEEDLGKDELWKNGKCVAVFEAQQIAKIGKHGSGCVLSASIAAALAKGQSLIEACRSAKQYTEAFLNSNGTLLGYHHVK